MYFYQAEWFFLILCLSGWLNLELRFLEAIMRNGLAESYIPKEIREIYIIMVAFWASYILGNILCLSTSPTLDIITVIIGSLICINIAVVGASFFDIFATRFGSIPHYIFGIILWIGMSYFIYWPVKQLEFSITTPFVLHIWLGAAIYPLRVFATELCFVMAKILKPK